METLNLSKEDILNDIEVYQARLDRVKDRLRELPGDLRGAKLRVTRQRLRAEIKHVNGLIHMVSQAMSELEQAGGGIFSYEMPQGAISRTRSNVIK